MIVLTKKEIDDLYAEAAEFSGVHKYKTFERLYNAKNGKRKLSYAVYLAWFDLVFGLPEPMFAASDVGPVKCMVCDVDTRELMFYDKPNLRLLYPSEVNVLPTVFQSRAKARSAVWHHVQQSGEPMSHVKWEVVEAVENES